jgi:hypothetical protein
MTVPTTVLEIALSAPIIPPHPRVLLLFGQDQPIEEWLCRRGATVDSGFSTPSLGKLMKTESQWDLIVATNSSQRFYDTTSATEVTRFSRWLRDHSGLCLLSPRKVFVDQARNSVGPWRLDEAFFEVEFVSELNVEFQGDPIVALSDSVLWDGEKWRERAEFLANNQPRIKRTGNSGLEGRRRQHLSADGSIFKVEVGSPEYFESLETIKEAETIEALSPEIKQSLGFPEVLSLRRGRAVSALHRQAIVGTPLLEIDRESGISPAALFEQVIECAISYSRVGLFHNDFRPWNFLVTADGLTLIDYAGVSQFDLDARRLPQVAALLGTLVAVCDIDTGQKQIRMFEHFDEDVLGVLEPILDTLGIELESLYTSRWLELPDKRDRVLGASGAGLIELVGSICAER